MIKEIVKIILGIVIAGVFISGPFIMCIFANLFTLKWLLPNFWRNVWDTISNKVRRGWLWTMNHGSRFIYSQIKKLMRVV